MCSRIIEFRCLTDHNGPGADHQYLIDIVRLGIVLFLLFLMLLEREEDSSIKRTHSSKTQAVS